MSTAWHPRRDRARVPAWQPRRELRMFAGGVQNTFDNVHEGDVAEALQWCGLHPHVALAIVRERSRGQLRSGFAGVKAAELIFYNDAGSRGRVETPMSWNILLAKAKSAPRPRRRAFGRRVDLREEGACSRPRRCGAAAPLRRAADGFYARLIWAGNMLLLRRGRNPRQ